MPQLFGKVKTMMPVVEGEGANGRWVRGGIVVTPYSSPDRNVAFDAMGEEKVAVCRNLPIDSNVLVTYSLESREVNGKWFTSARLLNVRILEAKEVSSVE